MWCNAGMNQQMIIIKNDNILFFFATALHTIAHAKYHTVKKY